MTTTPIQLSPTGPSDTLIPDTQLCLESQPEGPLRGVVCNGIRVLSILAGAVAILGADKSPMSVWWGVFFAVSGIALSWLSTRSPMSMVTPVTFSSLYLLGYVTAFGLIVASPGEAVSQGYSSIGAFRFTDSEMAQPTIEIFGGLTGLVALTAISRRLARMPLPSRVTDSSRDISLLVAVWSLLAASTLAACAVFGLGRVGLTPSATLPFGVGGLLVYSRNFLVPALSALIFEQAILVGRYRAVWLLMGLVLGFSVTGAVLSLSRAFMQIALLPLALLFVDCDPRFSRFRKMALPVVIGAAVVAASIVGVVSDLRTSAYSSGELGYSDAVQSVGRQDGELESDLAQRAEDILKLATFRTGGAREHLALSTSSVSGLDAVLGVTFAEEATTRAITEDVFGFLPLSDETWSFGIGFGFWGQLSLAHSFTTMFLGTLLVGGVALALEWAFCRAGAIRLGRFVGVVVPLQIWTQLTWFVLSRVVVTFLMTLALVTWLRSRRHAT